jgi:hypothetical protein
MDIILTLKSPGRGSVMSLLIRQLPLESSQRRSKLLKLVSCLSSHRRSALRLSIDSVIDWVRSPRSQQSISLLHNDIADLFWTHDGHQFSLGVLVRDRRTGRLNSTIGVVKLMKCDFLFSHMLMETDAWRESCVKRSRKRHTGWTPFHSIARSNSSRL